MNAICNTIKEVFEDQAVMKDQAANSLFGGRNLPSFVRDYVLRRFSLADGSVNAEALDDYLRQKSLHTQKYSD